MAHKLELFLKNREIFNKFIKALEKVINIIYNIDDLIIKINHLEILLGIKSYKRIVIIDNKNKYIELKIPKNIKKTAKFYKKKYIEIIYDLITLEKQEQFYIGLIKELETNLIYC
jgi:polysaccharide deacetylase 2 family uncharacterized protein YibQ